MTALSVKLLVDTGPLVAWFDRADAAHPQIKRFLDVFQGELLSTWPVLTETCHLLPERLVPTFMQWVAGGGLTIAELPASAAASLAQRMGMYRDLPMDLADASLIWLAENLGVLDVLTLDRRDFGICRVERGKALRNVLDTPLKAKRAPPAAARSRAAPRARRRSTR